ncbi:hypothetical protein EFW17_17385 [Halostreptopolyspora alba]|uniref:Major facilitator superfamily (MFS) profile domain-containing protein n=1 Tax=Halostreptopolyspora alba TaxID=2487137 RepID=A0A3N0E5D8_9ACTN|nr:hypothetical protein EFW17_17385 [Nocardiopsaceae bacterium YIM 96095]
MTMRILLGALAGLFGGYLLGFVASTVAHIGLGSFVADSSPVLVAFGLAPYLTALVGAVLVPVILARRGPE